MSEPFLITGQPRSRTAWFAAAAMTDQSICCHEPTRYLNRWDDVFDAVWGGYGSRYAGISDHGLGFWLPEIMRRASPRTLIIERPVTDVKQSLARLGLPSSNFPDLLQEALAFDHPRIMRVPYANLEQSEVVMRCLRHLVPGAVISIARIRELQTLNIQAQTGESIQTGLRRGAAGDAATLLPPDVLARLRVG
jgi:hypothetical protein